MDDGHVLLKKVQGLCLLQIVSEDVKVADFCLHSSLSSFECLWGGARTITLHVPISERQGQYV